MPQEDTIIIKTHEMRHDGRILLGLDLPLAYYEWAALRVGNTEMRWQSAQEQSSEDGVVVRLYIGPFDTAEEALAEIARLQEAVPRARRLADEYRRKLGDLVGKSFPLKP